MKVSEAVASRITCRAFLPQPVPEATVRAILDAARQSPSGGNLQPWHVVALAGERLQALVALVAQRMTRQPGGEGGEYDIYPKDLKEPYRSRRYQCGEDLYATLGLGRDNKMGRLLQLAQNFHFFGAPVGLLFFIDRQMGADQWGDVGMYMQSVMLLAREHGLHTAPQESWSLWPKTIREFTGHAPELMLYCGMALGFMDESAPVNRLRTKRAALEEFARFEGF